MRYLLAFIHSVGDRWFLLPSFAAGCVGVIGILGKLGVTSIPELSWWAIAFFILLPISIWSIPALVKKVVSLEDQLAPRLRLGDLHIAREGTRQVLRFSVANKGIGVLSQCLVRLTKIEPLPEMATETQFPAILQTEAQRRRAQKVSRFSADAAEKYVVVALNAVDATQRTPISIPSEDRDFKLSRKQKYKLRLFVTCEAGRPLQLDFSLFVDENNELGIENNGDWQIHES